MIKKAFVYTSGTLLWIIFVLSVILCGTNTLFTTLV